MMRETVVFFFFFSIKQVGETKAVPVTGETKEEARKAARKKTTERFRVKAGLTPQKEELQPMEAPSPIQNIPSSVVDLTAKSYKCPGCRYSYGNKDLHGRNSFVVVKELILSAKNKLRKENGMLWLVTQNYIPVGMLYNATDWKSCECYSDGRFTVWKLTTGKKVVSKVLEDVDVIVGDKRKAEELQDSGGSCSSF